MEFYWISITIFAICLPLQCLTAPLTADDDDDKRKAQFGNQDAQFTSSGNTGNFQSWSDWLKKRSFGEYPFGDQNLQAWKEWMDKRGFLRSGTGPKFGEASGKPFQQWKDWMVKRGFPSTGNEAFKGMPPMDKAHFQTWNDWMIKRGLGGMGAGYSGTNFGQASGENLQSWGDFSKRADLVKDHDYLLDYIHKKNFGAVKPNDPFNVPFGSNPHLMKWDDMIKRNNEKRQLGSSPKGFGHNKQYFTNGLQDWRNTFDSSKRSAKSAKISPHESNSAVKSR